MTPRLSVNINKIATLRNARGGNNPNVVQTAIDIERFGAEGITVHPRPDERHIRYQDVRTLKKVLTTEFNIEGNPKHEPFVNLVLENKPNQVTLVPDAKGQITSNRGWDTEKEANYLKEIIPVFKKEGIRVSIFVDPIKREVIGAKACGADRVELYTESYARHYKKERTVAIQDYIQAAEEAKRQNLELNAGHDLDLSNLGYFVQNIPNLSEVSIGHALICDALIFGLQNTVSLYQRAIRTERNPGDK